MKTSSVFPSFNAPAVPIDVSMQFGSIHKADALRMAIATLIVLSLCVGCVQETNNEPHNRETLIRELQTHGGNGRVTTMRSVSGGQEERELVLVEPGIRFTVRTDVTSQLPSSLNPLIFQFSAGRVDQNHFRTGAKLKVWIELATPEGTKTLFAHRFDLLVPETNPKMHEVTYSIFRIQQKEGQEFWLCYAELEKSTKPKVEATGASPQQSKALVSQASPGDTDTSAFQQNFEWDLRANPKETVEQFVDRINQNGELSSDALSQLLEMWHAEHDSKDKTIPHLSITSFCSASYLADEIAKVDEDLVLYELVTGRFVELESIAMQLKINQEASFFADHTLRVKCRLMTDTTGEDFSLFDSPPSSR